MSKLIALMVLAGKLFVFNGLAGILCAYTGRKISEKSETDGVIIPLLVASSSVVVSSYLAIGALPRPEDSGPTEHLFVSILLGFLMGVLFVVIGICIETNLNLKEKSLSDVKDKLNVIANLCAAFKSQFLTEIRVVFGRK